MRIKLNKRGMTIIEMVVAMFITSLFLLSIPPLMKIINVNSRETVVITRDAVESHTAINSLIKDIKSSEDVTISADGKTLTLKRSAKESGIMYSIANGKLFVNNDIVLTNVTDGTFTMTGVVINVHLDIKDGLPIDLMLRRPNLKKLIDDGNVVLPPDFEKTGIALNVNGRSVTPTMSMSIPVVQEFAVDLSTVDPMARIVYYQVDGGERIEIRGSTTQLITTGVLKPVKLTVKVVAEDGITMQIYNITLQPQSADADRVPDWMWGGDESFRTFFRRKFGVNDLTTVTFGAVRRLSGALDFTTYRIADVGYIIGEFKAVTSMDFSNCRIFSLPPNFGESMRSLTSARFTGCVNLNVTDFRNKYNNAAWKNLNCPSLTVYWP